MFGLSTHRTALVVSVAFFVLSGSSCSTAVQNEDPAVITNATVFEGARIIVGDESSPIENGIFVVNEAQFVQVGSINEVEVPAGATRVDLTGRTVMPAVIDTHTHLGHSREELVEDLQRKAFYGVGVAMSLGQDEGALPFQVRAEMITNAARYRTAGRGITSPEPGRSEIPYWITSTQEARTAVKELAELKVDLVKIWVDDRNGQYEKLTPELYGAVISEAHRYGLRVTAHVFTLQDAKGLLRAGVDAFAHGVRDRDIDDEFVTLFKERPHVVLVPNLPTRGVVEDLNWLSETIPAEALRALQEASTDRPDSQQRFGIQARNLARLNAEGVRIAFGTDGGAGWSSHGEMADMVASGMTPAEVIVAATRNSADLLGLTDVGTVKIGQSADFVVLTSNPLEDITNTRHIESVYLRGTAVDRQGLSRRWIGRGES